MDTEAQGLTQLLDNQTKPGLRVRARSWGRLNRQMGVYFVGHGGLCKIGWSNDIGRRLRHLTTGTPFELELYGVVPDAYRDFEAKMHRRFAEYRVAREWFRLAGALFDFLEPIASRYQTKPLQD